MSGQFIVQFLGTCRTHVEPRLDSHGSCVGLSLYRDALMLGPC